jgi:hypothetical protein
MQHGSEVAKDDGAQGKHQISIEPAQHDR